MASVNKLKKIFFVIALTIAGIKALCQEEQTPFAKTSLPPFKKLLIHFDKPNYFAGDTLFFKAYIYSDYMLDLNSKSCFVGLFDDSGKNIIHKKFPIIEGSCYGNIEIPDSLSHGLYLFQAYTPSQLSEGDSILYLNPVFIINPSKISQKFLHPEKPVYNFRFFPQGQNFIEGIDNLIAFKASDQYGNSISINGNIVDENNEIVLEFSNSSDSERFMFSPEMRKYSAIISYPDGTIKKYVLPQVQKQGIVLKVFDNDSTKGFLIESHITDNFKNNELELLGSMNNQITIRQKINFIQNIYKGKISCTELPSGILYLAVADKNGRILSSAATFINNKEYQGKVLLNADTLDFNIMGRNIFTFTFPDSLIASLSLSITDKSKTTFIDNPVNNFASDALLNTESRAFIKNSTNFISDTSTNGRKKLDFLMQTGNWKTPNWNMLFENKKDDIKDSDDSFINITGKVFKDGTKKLMRNGDINFMLRTKDSLTNFVQTTINQDGSFSLNNLIYEDTATFGYQMAKGKDGAIFVIVDTPKNTPVMGLMSRLSEPEFDYDRLILKDSLQKNKLIHLYQVLNDSSWKGKTLTEAIVTTRKKNPTLLVNERYATGLFSGMTFSKVLDFINDPPGSSAPNIFEYLRGRISGLLISQKGGQYIIQSSRVLFGLVEGKFFLNESEVTSGDVAYLPISQIALIKYFSPGTAMIPDAGTVPVLAIYTKTWQDIANDKSSSSFFNKFRYPGYSSSNLLYDSENNQSYYGSRGTLLWRPDLYLSGESKEIKVSFYNLTGTKEFNVVLQGVMANGELIYFEKTISADK